MRFLIRSVLPIFTLCICLSIPVHGQFWMQQAGGLTIDEAYDIDLDNSGNTYTVGYFTGTATFGTTTLTTSGSTDIFLTKTDNQGNFEWAVSAGGVGGDRGLSIQTDGAGNSYITGFYNATATFGTQSITSAGLQDVFIAKYDSNGNLEWVESAGGADSDIGNGIAVDNAGDVIVTGEFQGTSTFGTSTFNSALNSTDVFIYKVDGTNGSGIWAKHGSANLTDRGIDVDCDGSDNVYVTGQFSETITFDQVHTNTTLNAVFVIKFSSNGTEDWFRIMGGGSSNIPNSIRADNNGNCFVAGDFTGTMTLFGNPNTTLTSTYSDRIFIAKYTSSGAVDWATASGSDNPISVRSINLDASGQPIVTGYFECVLTEFSDFYGEGIFNSVGFRDIFISRYSTTGVWDLARHLGGRSNDAGFGIASDANDRIHLAGSFQTELFFPTSVNFLTNNLNNWNFVSCASNSPYCNDNDYGSFYGVPSNGNLDAVIANAIDFTREPYDFFVRGGINCVRDRIGVCAGQNCPDTLFDCIAVNAQVQNNTCSSIGPGYSYLWSTSDTTTSSVISNAGFHWVEATSRDGCFMSRDSVYVQIYPTPADPTLTDDQGVNTNAISPSVVQACVPDSVELTGGNFGSSSVLWTGPGLGSGVPNPSIFVNQTGIYVFTVTDSNGCQNNVSVFVEFFDPLPPFDLELFVDDTMQVCDNDSLMIMAYDSVGNPSASSLCFTAQPYNVTSVWTVTPNIPSSIGCHTFATLGIPDTGYYFVEVMLVRSTPCEIDTHFVSDSIYVETLPAPTLPPLNILISGSDYYCPGSTAMQVATGGQTYLWTFPSGATSTNDTIFAGMDGTYQVTSSESDTNSFGCFTSVQANAIKTILVKPQPFVSASSTLICPNDTVILTCNSSGANDGFFWEGPNGPIGIDSVQIEVTDPGLYFCTVNDSDSCALLSNTIELTQYTTPTILVNGNLFLCDGDSVVISAVASNDAVIEWQAPLTGDTSHQVIYSPGTYTAKITSCNIEAFADIEILPAVVEANISASDELCIGESITLDGNPGMAEYLWSPNGDTTSSITVFNPDTFVLTTTDTNGCSIVSDTFIVTLDQVPTVITLNGNTTFCLGETVTLTGNSDMATYLWSPGGQTTSTIVVDSAGTYSLTTLDTNGCTGTSNSITVNIAPTETNADIFGPLEFCEGDSVVLSAINGNAAAYSWAPNNDTTASITVFSSGTFTLSTIDQFGCIATADSIVVSVQDNVLTPPVVDGDFICAGLQTTLTASTPIGTILWFTENGTEPIETGPVLGTENLVANTTYRLVSREFLCSSEETLVEVSVEDCGTISIPNIFTPNRDGVNDLFLVQLARSTCFNMRIYNRWGQLLYEGNRIDEGWDGTLTGTGIQAADGIYFYQVDYCRHDGSTGTEKGSLTLLRNPR